MDLELAEHQAHERYINHVMACAGCHAPVKRYCIQGQPLHVDHIAYFLMGRDIHTRRVHLTAMETTDPGLIEPVKERLIAIHDQLRGDEEE